MPDIRWRHDGAKLIVRAVVLPLVGAPNEGQAFEVRGLIDTGATSSGITPLVSEKLALPSLGKKPVQTAGGLVQADRFGFRLGFFPDEENLPWVDEPTPSFPHILAQSIYGIGLTTNGNFELIIGMDVLGRNHLEMLPDRSCRFSFEVG